MKKSKVHLLFILLIVLSLAGCQSDGEDQVTLLKEELTSVKAELQDTKKALNSAEEEIERLKRERADELDILNGTSEIQNKDAKIAAIKASIEELDILIQSAYKSDDLAQQLEDFAGRQSIDLYYVYFGSPDDTFTMSPATELPEDYRISQRPVYKEAVKNGLYVAEVYVDAFENKSIQTISKAIYINNELIGVIGIDAYLN